MIDDDTLEQEWAEAPEPSQVVPDVAKTVGILLAATLLSAGFDLLGFSEASLVITYVLGVVVIAITTSRRAYCFVASALAVVAFNFFFATPRYSFEAAGSEYPSTFAVLFVVALIVSTLAMRLRDQAKTSAADSRRTQVLLDTDQLLEACHDTRGIVDVMTGQLVRLLHRDVMWIPVDGEGLGAATAHPAAPEANSGREALATCERERDVVTWVRDHNQRAGATTHEFPDAQGLYLAVRVDEAVFGVVGVLMGEDSLDQFEKGLVLSIVGETSLALERERALAAREEAALLAQNEQLRSSLLRSISHDLRTPLTAIAGNADLLLDEGASVDEAHRRELLEGISDDARWLTNLVENLLAITRLEDGTVSLNISVELVEDVVEEALRHVGRDAARHQIVVVPSPCLLLARMDARLVVLVVVNLVNNAIAYTPEGSRIEISGRHVGDFVEVTVADDGPGVADADKDRIFDSFYTANHGLADGHRSVGLGLALCRTIVTALGGTISVADNSPHGAVFRFTLPAEEAPHDANTSR